MFRGGVVRGGPRRAGGALRSERRRQVDAAAPDAGAARAVGGEVRLGGVRWRRCRRRQIARRAALLPQDAPVELPLTVREAVALGRLPHLRAVSTRGGGRRRGGRRARWRPPTPRRSPSGRSPSSRAASATASTWRARWRRRRRSCCSTSRSRGSISRTSSRRWICCGRRSSTAGAAAGGAARSVAGGAQLRPDAACSPTASCAPTPRPAAVLTPENLAQVFGVEAEVRLDRDGRPLVVPHEPAPGRSARGRGEVRARSSAPIGALAVLAVPAAAARRLKSRVAAAPRDTTDRHRQRRRQPTTPREDSSGGRVGDLSAESPRASTISGRSCWRSPAWWWRAPARDAGSPRLAPRGSNPDEVASTSTACRSTSLRAGRVDISTLPLGDVERVEVYRGATPLAFGESALGGIVVDHHPDAGRQPRPGARRRPAHSGRVRRHLGGGTRRQAAVLSGRTRLFVAG